MNEFKASINKYDQCALSKAVPVKLCFECLKYFDNITESYDMLLKGTEITPEQVTVHCADEYLNQDGLNIVEMIFLHAREIWDKAYCETCFDRSKNNIPKSDDVKEFENRDYAFKDCETKSQEEQRDPCKICSSQYENLNQEFKLLEDVRGGKICFDIQDRVRFCLSKLIFNYN